MNANVYLANFLRGFFCEAQRAFTPVTFHLKLKTLQFIFFTRFSFRNLIRHCFLFFFFLQNSIRHNLSLHSRFVRVQNEGTGKSSWWMLNPEGGKSGKSPRRRAASMDNNSKFTKSRGRAAKKKVRPRSHANAYANVTANANANDGAENRWLHQHRGKVQRSDWNNTQQNGINIETNILHITSQINRWNISEWKPDSRK